MGTKKAHEEVMTCFIIPSFYKRKDEVNDTMKKAFQEAEEAGLSPKWQKEANCDVDNISNDMMVFVLQEFKGELFSKLRSTDSLVCGPMCILSCIEAGLPIPYRKNPVYTTAMRNAIVSASQFPADVKMNIRERVQYMGGVYMETLTDSVTHLVTYAIGSPKYEVARHKRIPIMTKEWVDAVWENSQKSIIMATDPEYIERYKCPTFLNMIITCSHLSKEENEEMEDLIIQNGGTYKKYFYQLETTLVVIKEPRGTKYECARSLDLPCVLPSFIRESAACGYAVPFKDHIIQTAVSCSTLAYSSSHHSSTIDEPNKSKFYGVENFLDGCKYCLNPDEELPIQYYHQLLSLDVGKKPLANCCITLNKFFCKERAFFKKLVQLLGATPQVPFVKFANIQQGLLPSTHLVCTEPVGPNYVLSVNWGVPAVTKDWLLDCARQGIRLSEMQYLVTSFQNKALPLGTDKNLMTSDTPLGAIPSITKTLASMMTPSPHVLLSELTSPALSAITHQAVSSLKRTSSAKTPDERSPFHVCTPDTL